MLNGKKKNCKQRLKFRFKEMYFTFTFNDMKSFLSFNTLIGLKRHHSNISMRKMSLVIFYMHETYEYLKNILFSSDVKYLSATKHCISLDAIDANIQVPNKYYARGTFLYMSKFLHCTKKK